MAISGREQGETFVAMAKEGRGGVVPSRVHYRGMHFWSIPRIIFGVTFRTWERVTGNDNLLDAQV